MTVINEFNDRYQTKKPPQLNEMAFLKI